MNGRTWRIELFGALKVISPEGAVTYPGAGKAAEVIAYLATHFGESVTRHRLIDRIWLDSDAAAVRTRLRQELHKLRTQFPAEGENALLFTNADNVWLTPTAITDVDIFRGLIAEAEQVPNRAGELLLAAADIYNIGVLLADFNSLWAMQLRARESARLSSAISRLLREERTTNTLSHSMKLQLLSALQSADPEEAKGVSFSALPQAAQGAAAITPAVPAGFTPRIAREPVPGMVTGAAVPAPPEYARYTRQHVALLLAGLVLLSLFVIGVGHTRRSGKTEPAVRSVVAGGPNKPEWVYRKPAFATQKGSSSAVCILSSLSGWIVCGLTDTDTDDTDITTARLGPGGEEKWVKRFSSQWHECDRCFSVSEDSQQRVFIGGESFNPVANNGEGEWRTLLICYSKTGSLEWFRYSPEPSENRDHRVTVKRDGSGGCYIGYTASSDKRLCAVIDHYNAYGFRSWSRRILPNNPAKQQTLFQDLDCDSRGGVVAAALLRSHTGGSNDAWCTAAFDSLGSPRFERKNLAAVPEDAHCALYVHTTRANGVIICGTVLAGGADTEPQPGIASLAEDGTTKWLQTIPAVPGAQKRVSCTAIGPNSELAIGCNSTLPSGVIAGTVAVLSPLGKLQWLKSDLAPAGCESSEVRAIGIDIADRICTLVVGAPPGVHTMDCECTAHTLAWRMDGSEILRSILMQPVPHDRQNALCMAVTDGKALTAGQEGLLGGAPPTLFAAQLRLP